MNGQALYRRWRSQNFDEIIAQEHVTRTLQNALRAGRIAHAYLFTGPRGTGKTSTARILAKAVNCLAEPAERPCNRCARCQAVNEGRDLDLIEIDAASNRGIDEIRDLRDKVAFVPNEGRYKVYVVDEVHMLTTEAFNALLKTLEEPPAHVIFVLATTEPQRIPATILSRCQRFDFRRIPLADLSRKLERISQAEGIRIEPAALEAIARRAGGSFRDAESLLDQLAASGDAEITLERVRELLGGVSAQAVGDLVDAWIAADLAQGLRLINRLIDGGSDARQVHQELIEYLRGLLLLRAGGDERLVNTTPEVLARMRGQLAGLSLGRLVEGLKLFSQGEVAARGDVRPQLPLELAFAQAVLAASGREEARPQPAPAAEAQASAPRERRPAAAAAPSRPAAAVAEQGAARNDGAAAATQATAAPAEATPEAPGGEALARLVECWPRLLQALRERSRPLEALLRSGRPHEVVGNRVVLAMEGNFHRERVMEERNRRLLEDTLQHLLGMPCQVECVVGGRQKAPPARRSPAPPEQPARAPEQALDHPVVRDDPILRYAVHDLGAQVGGIEPIDDEAETGTE